MRRESRQLAQMPEFLQFNVLKFVELIGGCAIEITAVGHGARPTVPPAFHQTCARGHPPLPSSRPGWRARTASTMVRQLSAVIPPPMATGQVETAHTRWLKPRSQRPALGGRCPVPCCLLKRHRPRCRIAARNAVLQRSRTKLPPALIWGSGDGLDDPDLIGGQRLALGRRCLPASRGSGAGPDRAVDPTSGQESVLALRQ